MDNNEHHSVNGTGGANGAVAHHDEADLTGPPVSEEQKSLHEEVERLRLEVEHLLDQQKAFQRTPQSKDLQVGDEVHKYERDDSSTRDPAGRRGVLTRRPVRLFLALIIAACLCAGGLRFWHYIQSYEWTDDAEIDGHLDPLSTL